MRSAFARPVARQNTRGITNSLRGFRAIRFGIPLALLLALAPQIGHSTTLSDSKGTKGSCIGIGPIVNKCAQIMENSGLIKVSNVGTTGLTFEVSGKGDGRIAQIVPGSAGALAGLQVGDMIVAINGKATKLTPGMIATERTFGVRGEGVQIKVRRAGKELEFNVVRDPQAAPAGPELGTILISVKPMINWKGQFIPCMGAGPAGFAAVDICYKIFGKDGYVKVAELGSTGLQLDVYRADTAIIASILTVPRRRQV